MSSDLIWKEEYNVGDYEIDEEHKIFLKTIQKIDEAFLNQESNEYIERLLEELHKYAQFHFISEENIMFKFGYPGLEEHHAEHVALMKKMGSLLITFDPRLVDSKKLINFLVDWFKNHTTNSDRKLVQFIMNKDNC